MKNLKFKVNQELVLKCQTLGKEAYIQEKKCIPVHDPEMMTILKNNKFQVGESIAYLDAWLKGWTLENLK